MFWHPSFSALQILAQNTTATPEANRAAETVRWWSSYLDFIPEAARVWVVVAIIALLGVALPVALGGLLSRSLRMREYGGKLGVIFCTLAMAGLVIAAAWPPKLGIDLKGGVILIYEISGSARGPAEGEEAPDADGDGLPDRNRSSVDVNTLIQAISRRINPSGVKEVVVRPYGENEVEIIIPEINAAEVANIKRIIATAGFLRFAIVADRVKHAQLIRLAEGEPEARDVYDEYEADGKVHRIRKGFWVHVGRDKEEGPGGLRKLKVDVAADVIRDAETKQWIDVPGTVDREEYGFERWLQGQGINQVEVLMADEGVDLGGDDLSNVGSDFDERLNPMVRFAMTSEGSVKMSQLTSANLPTDNRVYRLGIILDDDLLSAPVVRSTISDRGQITGNFTQEEVDFLVSILNAGKLPAALNKTPISESQIDPLLGVATIRQGSWAIGISLVAVLVFMLIYYRFAGLTACVALIANLVLIVGLMMLVRAAFTLPGLAGLVLTVGMSVDANVLIFERIREELNRGSALRMAIRNGFSRATTTIVDANLTTLITAIVLYAIGTDQVRGFAVTLILGILMSMYTAIYCSRAFFDIAERKRWITRLSMMSIVGSTHIDFIGKRKLAVGLSVLAIVVGLVGVGLRGKNIFDIDFLGGSAVDVTLVQPMSDAKMRSRLSETFGPNWANIQKKLDEQAVKRLRAMSQSQLNNVTEELKMKNIDRDELAGKPDEQILKLALLVRYGEGFERPEGQQDVQVSQLTTEGTARDRVYKVVTSIQSDEYLKDVIREVFQENGKSLLESYSMSYEKLVAKVIEPEKPAKGNSTTETGDGTLPGFPAGGGLPEFPDKVPGSTLPQTPGGLSFPKPSGRSDAPPKGGSFTPVTPPGGTEPAKPDSKPADSKPAESKPAESKPDAAGADKAVDDKSGNSKTNGGAPPAPGKSAGPAKPAEPGKPAEPAENSEPSTPAKGSDQKPDAGSPEKKSEPESDGGSARLLLGNELFVSYAGPVISADEDSSEEKSSPAADNKEDSGDAPKTEDEASKSDGEAPKPDASKAEPAKPETEASQKGEGDQSKPDQPTGEPSKADQPKDESSKNEPSKPETSNPENPKAEPPKPEEPKAEPPKPSEPAQPAPGTSPPAPGEPSTAPPTPGEPTTPGEAAPSTPGEPVPPPAQVTVTTETTINFAKNKMAYGALHDKIVSVGRELLDLDLEPKMRPRGEGAENWDVNSSLAFQTWEVTLNADEDQTRQVLDRVQRDFASSTVWTSSSKIGGQVAGNTQSYAIMALLTSLLGIIGYIWWRFQKVIYGLAAVIALIHDVLITLGAIALSYWLVTALAFLQIEEFKISLPVVAALLTIIGYSLNDTIVVFDRIREVRGKSPNLTSEMINTSINQTLSRTLLTSLTTFLVVVILYFIGGEGIHAFAFCLVVGVLVGTYSSIFIASPFLLWMTGAKFEKEQSA